MKLVYNIATVLALLSISTQARVVASLSINHDSNAASINDLLLEKAVPLAEYERKHIAAGGTPFRHKLRRNLTSQEQRQPIFMNVDTGSKRGRKLGSSNNNDNSYYNYNKVDDNYADDKHKEDGYDDDDDDDDDNDYNNNNNVNYYAEEKDDAEYYSDYLEDDYFNRKNSHSFQGYSLKFTTCQTVQRFSADAVQRGEYSSMVSDDIVVLRLCPTKSCSTYSQYGCSSGYGEYAMAASEYMKIVMKYNFAKEQRFCAFCDICNQGNGSSKLYDANACYTYSNECSNYYSDCGNNDDGGGQKESMYLQYLDYMDCKMMQYNGNYYWVSPHCDADGKISMGIYYDNYCDQYAGDDVDVTKYMGNNFNTNFFSKAQEIDCLDCSESSYGPFYNANNQLCNNIYKRSGRCNMYLAYDLGKINYGDDDDGNDDDYDTKNQEKVQCSFMESIRYGTYDSYGEIYMSSSQSTSLKASVTAGQKFILFVISMVALGLALYSCFLHHELTNLLLKSLSSGLIPKTRRSSSRGRSLSRNYRSSNARPTSASTKPASNTKKSYERPMSAASTSDKTKSSLVASKYASRPTSATSKSSKDSKQTNKKIMKESFSLESASSSADYTLDSSVGSSSSEESSTLGGSGSSSFSVGSSTLGSYAVSKDEN